MAIKEAITSDIYLRGKSWRDATENLACLFERPNYDTYMLALSIGVMYDQTIEEPEEDGEDPKSVPRNVINNNDGGKLSFIHQAAVLSTKTVDWDEDTRLKNAFGEDLTLNEKIKFLTPFANFGVTKLCELLSDNPIELMENLKNFATSSIEGMNFDIDGLPEDEMDEIMSEEIENSVETL